MQDTRIYSGSLVRVTNKKSYLYGKVGTVREIYKNCFKVFFGNQILDPRQSFQEHLLIVLPNECEKVDRPRVEYPE